MPVPVAADGAGDIQQEVEDDAQLAYGLNATGLTPELEPEPEPESGGGDGGGDRGGSPWRMKRNQQRGALRGSRGEFYDGNQILITDAEGRQATNQNYTPFEGAGATTATEGATGLDSDGGGRRRGRPWAVS